jgi:hypothetical protein
MHVWMEMRKVPALTVSLFGLAIAPAAPAEPSWCGGGSQGNCANAQADFNVALSNRFGEAWDNFNNWEDDPACPGALAYHGRVDCMAYFRWNGISRFVQGTVSASQSQNGSASFQYVTSWHRRWGRCSLRGYGLKNPGRLESNNNCGQRMPQTDVYFVGQEMSYAGRVYYTHEVGWLFASSGLFIEAGMTPVGIYHCGYKHHTITCSNRVGDSFRYIY